MLETKLLAAFDSMSDGMVLLDAQDRVAGWNRAYEQLVPDLIPHIRRGMDYRDALVAIARIRRGLVDPAAIEAAVAARLALRRHAGVPFDSPRPDGGVTQIVERPTPDGGWVISYRDVTAERRATIALAAAKAEAERLETLFRDGLGSLNDGFMLLDEQERIVTWNAAYCRFFVDGSKVARVGMTFEEYIRATRRLRGMREPDWDAEAAIRARLDAHRIIGVPYEIRAVNGMVIQAIVQRTSTGGKIVVFRDITAERRALDAANEIAAEYRDGMESMLDAFAHYDASQRLLRWNSRYESMFPHLEGRLVRGMTLREVMLLHARSPLYAIARDEEEAWVAATISTVWDAAGPASITREFDDGRAIWGLTTRSRSGGLIFVMRDISERIAQEKRLAEALRRERSLSAQQRRFVAVTAHEFRTPLTIIDGAAQRLARNAEDVVPEELRQRVARIRDAVARMAQLIDSTLSLARLDDGAIAIKPTRLDLGTHVAATCRRFEGLVEGFAIELDQPPAPVEVMADAALLDQIVGNLLSNAIKYSGESRRIEVSVARVVDKAVVAVRDFGIGIPQDEVPHLFDRFYRASTAKGLPGTGIGLALVRELVALHGGVIELETRVDHGSRFVVTLPLAPAVPSAGAQTSTELDLPPPRAAAG
jgi:signal transduction histidine kinase